MHERERRWTAGRIVTATLWVGITWIIFLPLVLLSIALGCMGVALGAAWVWEPSWMREVERIFLEALGEVPPI